MFTPAAAYRVYDLFPPEWVTQLPDGRFFVSAFYPESPWIYGFLLSFGADVAVLSPPQVQQALREAGQKVAALYGAPEGPFGARPAAENLFFLLNMTQDVIFPGLY